MSMSKPTKKREARLVKVRATPKAKREMIIEKEGVFHISTKEQAKDNAANGRIRYLLARELSLPEKAVRLTSGHRSPSKTFTIQAPEN